MICWHSVAGSQDNHGKKDSVAYPLISLHFFLFPALRLTPIIAEPNKGREAFRKELASWKSKCCVLVSWSRQAGGIIVLWKNMTMYKASSEFSMWQIASVCAPRPHPQCLSFEMKTSKKKKDSQNDADATPQSHLPTQQSKPCCVLENVRLKKDLPCTNWERMRGSVLMC